MKKETYATNTLSTVTDAFFDDLQEPEKIKIAVVMPVYNTAAYLCECIESILQQTHTNFVVFAVDDGSLDESGLLLDEYADRDNRIRVFHKNNEGVSSARNFALEQIEKDGSFHLVAFCDSDDVVAPDFLRLYANGVTKFRAEFVMIGYVSFDKKGVVRKEREVHSPILLLGEDVLKFGFGLHPKSKKSPATAYFLNNVSFCSWMIRGLRFQLGRNVGEDADFRFRALLRSNKGVAMSDVGYNYRVRKSSLSNKMSLSFLFAELELYIMWMRETDRLSVEFLKNIRRLAFKKFRQALIWAYEHNELEYSWDKFEDYYRKIRSGLFVPCSGRGVFLLFYCGPKITKWYLSLRRRNSRSHENKHKAKMFSAFE